MTYKTLKDRVKRLPSVTARPMFGYECYSAKGKFFVGFGKKNDYEVIVRITKDEQKKAIKNKGIKPFSHGARAGWIEIDTRSATTIDAFKWIKKGYTNALTLSKNSR
jgi:predicted DNA-binding protein (MmcQ/YjbR family)